MSVACGSAGNGRYKKAGFVVSGIFDIDHAKAKQVPNSKATFVLVNFVHCPCGTSPVFSSTGGRWQVGHSNMPCKDGGHHPQCVEGPFQQSNDKKVVKNAGGCHTYVRLCC